MSATTCQWPAPCPSPVEIRGHCVRHYKQLWWTSRMPSTLVDARPTRDRIHAQLDRGRTVWSLAHASGIDNKAIDAIRDGVTTKVRARTATRILAVPLRASRIGCIRRIQALTRLGHTRAHLATEVGCSVGGLKTIPSGRHPVVTSVIADGLTDAYERLSRTPGTSRWVASIAARHGYPPPWAWDGRDIDDPAATPDTRPAIRGAQPRGRHGQGSAAYIAARTGMAVQEIERAQQRRGDAA